jgi:hypothetical protein
MMDSTCVVPCDCGSCPVRDAGFKPEAYRGESLGLGPWMALEGYPARLLACQFPTQEAAERWARDQVDASLH